ncbi:MAG: Kelch repeat-containing protein [Gammaproteobacteria bacterium]
MRLLLLLLIVLASGTVQAQEKVWVSGWRQSAPLQVQRAGAAVVAVGEHLYVIGGIDGRDFLRAVEYSRFRPDGSLEPWRRTSTLREARGFFGAVAQGGYLYAVGGANGPNGKHLLRSVERAAIHPDGSLGPWKTLAAALNYPRRCVKLALVDQVIYALGGFAGSLLDSVERATIDAKGGLGPWTLLDERLTMPRYVNTVKKHGAAVYVIGGHNEAEGSGLVEVEYARRNAAGTLSPWRRTAPLAVGRYALAAAAQGDYLYALGGLEGAIYSRMIEKSRIDGHGGLRPWQTTTSLSSPRANFGVVVHKGRIYIIGGTNRDGYYRSVEYARFNDSGDIGFHASPTEAASYENQRRAREQGARPPLPNAGVVTDIIHTRIYSYIEVESGATRKWLAAPRSEFAIGQHIRYSRGVTMTNFHSKTLNRDFPLIIFVERVEPDGGR